MTTEHITLTMIFLLGTAVWFAGYKALNDFYLCVKCTDSKYWNSMLLQLIGILMILFTCIRMQEI